jgi:hypothetical protein
MNEVQQIIDQYDQVMHGSPWHGDAIWKILDGISAEKAASQSITNVHTIWEIVGHMAFWEAVAAKRLGGLRAGREEERNFPATPDERSATFRRRPTLWMPTGRRHSTGFVHPIKHFGRRCKKSVLHAWTKKRLPASARFTKRPTD